MINREDLIEQMRREGENFELEHPTGTGDEEHIHEDMVNDEI